MHGFIIIAILALYTYIFFFRFLQFPPQRVEDVDLSSGIDGSVTPNVTTTIDKAHRQGLYHRGCWILVFDMEMRHTLFLKRNSDMKTCPSTWGIIGEHTKIGESYKDAALRGVREELGLTESDFSAFFPISPTPELFHLKYDSPYKRRDRQWTMTFFATLKVNATYFHVDQLENSGYVWIKKEDALGWISYCDDKEVRTYLCYINIIIVLLALFGIR